MADGAMDDATFAAYGVAQARLEHAGGYNWREAVNATLHGLGFRDEHLDRSLETFSGGELTRASLARALAGDPDLLLLDEPTNHLDIASLEWLEGYLQQVDAAVVLVAHDRWFLEAVGTSVLELEAGRGKFFKGTWHAWRAEKAQRELALGRAIEKQTAEIAKLERFVDRFRAGTRARQAQARQKKLEKIDRLVARPEGRQGARVRLQAARALRPGRVRGRGRAAEDRRPDAAAGRRAVARTRRARVAGRRQRLRQDDPDLRPDRRPRVRRRQAAPRPQRQARAARPAHRRHVRHGLGGRGLPARDGADPEQRAIPARPVPVQRRGGREAARRALRRRAPAALAGDPRALRRQRPDPRRADEPSRRREPRGAGGRAAGLPGRAAADLPRPCAAGRRRLAHRRDRGPDAALLRRRLARVRARARGAGRGREDRQAVQARGQAGRPAAAPDAPKPRSKNEQARAKKLEAEIERAEAALAALEVELADPGAWNDPRTAAKSTARHADAKKTLEELYARWEAVAG